MKPCLNFVLLNHCILSEFHWHVVRYCPRALGEVGMASSDDEAEAVPSTVSNYEFVDDKDEPVSFAELTFQWNDTESLDGNKRHVFLRGTADNGLQKIYKQVTTWKIDSSRIEPAISVLSKENDWIKLEKPRKAFQDTIRSILITVHSLHFLKRNPESSGRALWDHLSKVFRFAYRYLVY